MTKKEEIYEPFYQYLKEPSNNPRWVELRDLIDELIGKIERPQGKWKIYRGGVFGVDKLICERCGDIIYDNGHCNNCGTGEWNFCPNCGADMRGEE